MRSTRVFVHPCRQVHLIMAMSLWTWPKKILTSKLLGRAPMPGNTGSQLPALRLRSNKPRRAKAQSVPTKPYPQPTRVSPTQWSHTAMNTGAPNTKRNSATLVHSNVSAYQRARCRTSGSESTEKLRENPKPQTDAVHVSAVEPSKAQNTATRVYHHVQNM